MDELGPLNELCKNLYNSTDVETRQTAEKNLTELTESPECLQRCMLLLTRGEYPYAPMVASTTLMKLVSMKRSITSEQKLQLAQFLLNMLGQGAPNFPQYLTTSLCQLFARLTKQEWIFKQNEDGEDTDDKAFPFREPVDSLIKTVDIQNISESLLAVQLLSLLVTDMNSNLGMEAVNKHRKCLSMFRDSKLYDIFLLSKSFLETVVSRDLSQAQLGLVEAVLELCLNCLLFDYIGSLADETADDNNNVQIPTAWKNTFTDGRIVELMFRLYHKLPQTASRKILNILAQLASIRRTLFTGAERQEYLNRLTDGVVSVIQNNEKLSDQGAFHEFCRLISRLKTNYQLSELINSPAYSQMVQLIAQFTVHSVRLVEFAQNSTFFLLSFWQRMVTSVVYIKTNDPHMLNVYCPEITTAFTESRLSHVEQVVRDGADEPLDDIGSTIQINELLAIICRCEYESTFKLLATHFDENATRWMDKSLDETNLMIAEGRLSWIITLIGTAIFGKTTGTANETYDKLDGELMARCLSMMRYSDESLQYGHQTGKRMESKIRLEIAFLYLLEQFRKAYIIDQVTRASPVYEKLSEELQIADEGDLLRFIVQKIITNLKYWATNTDLLEMSLSLLKDLSLGYTAVKKLFRLSEIQLLLNNHTSENFLFLGPSVDYATMKLRTVFYEALMRLLMADINDEEELFTRFIQPLSITVNAIVQVISNNCQGLEETQLMKVIVGLCRDIRGMSTACTSKPVFYTLFEWMYPNVFNILLFSVERWPGEHEITTPILRLLSELATNRQQRHKFEMSSCSPILLFREMSKIISTYGNLLLTLPKVPESRVYKERYKNIGIIFQTLNNAFVGPYVPCGVFRLYGDTCLQDSLDIFIKLFMEFPVEDFHGYPKIAQNYYNLLENVTQENMPYITNLCTDVICAILKSVQSGITSLNVVVMTSACSVMDIILNYLYKRIRRGAAASTKVGQEPEGDNMIRAIEENPHILADLLQTLVSIMLFGDSKCQWSLSRPMLGLILIQQDVFEKVKTDLTRQQTFEKQPKFEEAFTQLMNGVENSLSVKNKDTFTQNLSKFKRDIVEILKGKDIESGRGGGMVEMF